MLDTLVVWLSARGLRVAQDGVALLFPNSGPARSAGSWPRIAASDPPGARDLAAFVVNKQTEKFHPYLSEPLLALDYASGRLDVEGAWAVAREIAGHGR